MSNRRGFFKQVFALPVAATLKPSGRTDEQPAKTIPPCNMRGEINGVPVHVKSFECVYDYGHMIHVCGYMDDFDGLYHIAKTAHDIDFSVWKKKNGKKTLLIEGDEAFLTVDREDSSFHIRTYSFFLYKENLIS